MLLSKILYLSVRFISSTSYGSVLRPKLCADIRIKKDENDKTCGMRREDIHIGF